MDSPPTSVPRRTLPVVALLAIAAVAILWWHARQLQFFCDDSYISYRYSQNFAEGRGLVYNEGERVEGYTNFIWVVLIGIGMKLGLGAEALSLWLGVFFLLVTLAATAWEGRRLFASWAFALVPVVLLVCQGPMVLWSVSGLESSCFAAMTLFAVLAYERGFGSVKKLAGAGALYALSTMVRPDGVVFGAAAGLHLVVVGLVTRPQRLKSLLQRALALAGGFIALFGPFVLWRHAYYDDWLPNTFYVKAGSLVDLELGASYFATWLREYPLVATLAGLGLLAALLLPEWRAQRRTLLHYALAIVLFCGYIAWAGGDYMALYRFMVPVLPLAAPLATVALVSAFAGVARFKVPAPVATLIGLVVLGATGSRLWIPTQKSLDGVEMSKTMRTVKGMKQNSLQWTLMGKAVNATLPADATIATTAAGALPFFAGQRCIDQSGLCDRHTAKVESDPWMLDRPGHMKQSTRSYLGLRRPEAIFWHPQFEKAITPPGIAPPTPDYEMRAMAVPGLDDDGRVLFFWVRKDKVKEWEPRGIVALSQAGRLVKAKPAAQGKVEPEPQSPKNGEGRQVAAPPPLRMTGATRTGAAVFGVERVHELDPKADEARFSVDNVTRPLWLGGEELAVGLTGAPGSRLEFELASAPSGAELPGARTPQKVEVAFVTDGGRRALAVTAMEPLSPGRNPWRRYRAELAGSPPAKGRFEIAVDGKPAGTGSAWLVSVPRIVQSADATARPNFLLITIDTLRADYLGCYGHDRPTSPNIDTVAKQGVLFERAVSQAPWTLPSYSSTFSGLYPESHGVVMRDHRFGGRFVTFIEELARAGYATGGIASGTFTDAHWGFDQGFDSYDDLGMVVDETDLEKVAAAGGVSPSTPAAMREHAEQTINSPDVTARALAWLDAHRDRRFALFVHYFDPHAAFMPHPGISEKFPPRPVGADFPNPVDSAPEETAKLRALYEGEIAFTDQHIGRVLDKVAELGLDDETIVVVFADHGEAFKEHALGPREIVGHGSTLFNEQVHVPLILRVPGIAPGRVKSPVGNLDLGPTLLELCDVTPGWQPQGVSLVPMLRDKEAARESPVLAVLFHQMPPEGGTLSDRVQSIHRLDGGDDCAIEWWSPDTEKNNEKTGAQFLFDWSTNPHQDVRRNLLQPLHDRFQRMIESYRIRMRPALIQRLAVPDAANIDDSMRKKLQDLGYAGE